MAGEQSQDQPRAQAPSTRPQAPTPWQRFRPTAVVFAAIIGAVVWMSYYFTADLVMAGFEIVEQSDQPEDVKNGVIRLLTGIVSNMVAVAAITGLVGALKETISTGDNPQ